MGGCKKRLLLPNSLYVIPYKVDNTNQNMIGSIKYPNGDIALQLYSTLK